jgi:hypothetical protein
VSRHSAIFASIFFVGTVALPLSAMAYDEESLSRVFEKIGCEQTLAKGKRAILTISCDEAKVIANIPELQAIGLLNPDLTQGYINTHHLSLTGNTAMTAAEMALMVSYQENPTLDELRVEVTIGATDDYGNSAPHPAFSFGFDRATYARINWDNFDRRKLPNVSKRFVFSPWYQAGVLRQEY